MSNGDEPLTEKMTPASAPPQFPSPHTIDFTTDRAHYSRLILESFSREVRPELSSTWFIIVWVHYTYSKYLQGGVLLDADIYIPIIGVENKQFERNIMNRFLSICYRLSGCFIQTVLCSTK